jgi:hypothetical protein
MTDGVGGAALPDGPWVDCPWCDGTIPLSRYGLSEDEPDGRVAVCGSCGRRVFDLAPQHPGAG